ncbi:hypothetical protein [Streptomyces xanthii]|uniref:Uncharacterized protein n=1 Tax=Streptomyces xanthii TaxID=2768069 RepID=A0A7H1BGR7_9ACTN|nr:hypothetical protein [Streptomyces xanthii]QNS07922.1 hypothetical protein IAG42_32805 [Streptomyces xanthii]
MSDLAAIKTWWKHLGDDGFLVLPPPGRGRYTQSDGHEDAAELRAHQGLPAPVSFAYWHWQSHERAFDRSGALTGELVLHWGGDHTVVTAGLGEGPPGYRLENGGPQGAFVLDRITHRDAAGLPDPADPDGVRQFLAELDEPLDRSRHPSTYRPLSPSQADWLHARLADPLDLAAATPFAVSLERRDALTPDETERLLHAWQAAYPGRLADWEAWDDLLHALLRQDHAQAWAIVDALGARASDTLTEVPSERGLAAVREFALAGERSAVRDWLTLYRAFEEPDAVRAAVRIAAELAAHDAPEASLRSLRSALTGALTAGWREETGAGYRVQQLYAGLMDVRCATDPRLPRDLRVLAAHAVHDRVDLVREAVLRPEGSVFTGVDTVEVLADLDRFAEAVEGLLAGAGPDLTAYQGALCDVWHRYRTLTDADEAWLHARVADPDTELQGLGFCLELLLAHGRATRADADALLPRLKELTKKYETTYAEWRHPLVTLTCLALDLDHPAAAKLVAWWNGKRPVWKDQQRLLTHLGAPDEAKAAELWDFVASSAHDVGQLMTWVLVRARLDGEHPLLVADRLIGTPGLRDYVLHRVLLGVADPAQPLWHYSVDPRSRGWWQRAVEVAEHPGVSARAREIALGFARQHRLITHPDQLRPAPTEAERAAARDWLDRHDAGGA